ncbi:hypothetical protein ES332_A05G282700v1 [Gossypium tomentosum]|uniref:Zinc knuckle CX2CX4HX4C domain-containing protein n=1 Tax=Gossypium tomentosum TaxID=34277 RepID=A0A5D2QLF1_GOSTO|nr:hypothetical protein ES332_A05G282700v1 [Gossypium tomentosum]
MRIRAQIDIRCPLKRKKQVMFNRICSYVRFKYECLSLFCFYCGRLGHSDSFCEAKMLLGVEFAELGWDLSLRARSRRVLSMNSVWLRKENDSQREREGENCWGSMRKLLDDLIKGGDGMTIDLVLGFKLEGVSSTLDWKNVNLSSDFSHSVMENDMEDGILIGEERKKRARGVMQETSERDVTTEGNRRTVDSKQFLSVAAKRQADWSQ